MTPLELEAFADTTALAIRDAVQQAQQPLLNRIAELEARQLQVGPQGERGHKGDPGTVGPQGLSAYEIASQSGFTGTQKEWIESLRGRDGDTIINEVEPDPNTITTLVAHEVAKAVALLPQPTNGVDGRHGIDGKSLEPVDVEPLIRAEVDRAVSALPSPVVPASVVGGVVNREGELILTFSDGSAKHLGVVVGKDADIADVRRIVIDEVSKIPTPKDGKDGRDGVDGFNLEDFDSTFDGERGWTVSFSRGDLVKAKTHTLPNTIYRGVFKDGQQYDAGDSVTWAGSTWIAKTDTSAKPGLNTEESRAWQLSVKKGNDGKEGRPGPSGGIGPKGEKGDQGQRWS